MRIVADTNILVRAPVEDDPAQSGIARRWLTDAELVAVPLPVLCEFVWVLSRRYRRSRPDIAMAIRALIGVANVAVDRAAVEDGLAVLEAGGDFADGVIAHQGAWLGGDFFVSLDRKAVRLLSGQGRSARVPD